MVEAFEIIGQGIKKHENDEIEKQNKEIEKQKQKLKTKNFK